MNDDIDHTKTDRNLFMRMLAYGMRTTSEDDLVILAMMSGEPLKPESETVARVLHPRSAFTRDCIAAYVMGDADGRVGRPVTERASAKYISGYTSGMRNPVFEWVLYFLIIIPTS